MAAKKVARKKAPRAGRKAAKACAVPQIKETFVTIYVMGRSYKVPAEATIMGAIEYAGYRVIRGCGCRSGFCGACGTVYRTVGDARLRVALACQTLAQPDMHLAQLPSFPAPHGMYQMEALSNPADVVSELYPEVFRCLGCGTCNRACPQELLVKDGLYAYLWQLQQEKREHEIALETVADAV